MKTAVAPRTVEVPVERGGIGGVLVVPEGATGLVVFAHGSGSGRMSPRNRFVADALNTNGLATLLVDLLTAHEERVDERTGAFRFDIALLASRLLAAARWTASDEETRALNLGYFGASTGAAAALVAAAAQPRETRAVVSRGGRPDLAAEHLAQVVAPTLLIVGGRDAEVLRLNQAAYARLTCPKRLDVVPGATHLFEEPGALEAVARLAADWFLHHLGGAPG